MKNEIIEILKTHGESLLAEDGVDANVCETIADEIITSLNLWAAPVAAGLRPAAVEDKIAEKLGPRLAYHLHLRESRRAGLYLTEAGPKTFLGLGRMVLALVEDARFNVTGEVDPAPAVALRRAALVYQAGIANVFRVESFNLAPAGREAVRLLQGDFRSCEMFARGLAAAGVVVQSFGCNQAGDISGFSWSEDLGPFRESCRPVRPSDYSGAAAV